MWGLHILFTVVTTQQRSSAAVANVPPVTESYFKQLYVYLLVCQLMFAECVVLSSALRDSWLAFDIRDGVFQIEIGLGKAMMDKK